MLYQFLPRLSDDEYAALEQSIREHGVQVPILVDENRAIIDGHHRKEIADRLGVDCPRRFAMDLTDEQKRTLALSLNLDRRHLNREQKRELVERSLEADPHLSDRQHAERTGVSPSTVGSRRADMEQDGRLSNLDSRVSADGRERPASQPARIGPAVDTETGEVSDDYLPNDATGEEVTSGEGFAQPTDPEAASGGERVEPKEVPSSSPPTAPRPSVVGLDGKTYTRPIPRLDGRTREEADADRKHRERQEALIDLYSDQIGKALLGIGTYGHRDDPASVMAEFAPAHLNPPQMDRAYDLDNLKAARRFIDALIAWKEQQ